MNSTQPSHERDAPPSGELGVPVAVGIERQVRRWRLREVDGAADDVQPMPTFRQPAQETVGEQPVAVGAIVREQLPGVGDEDGERHGDGRSRTPFWYSS